VPQEAQAMYREKILYLPATTTFQPYEPALPPNVLPALANGFVTFCCLARINKLNRPLIAMWSRVLRALPTSRMLLLTIAGGGVPSVVLEWFVAEGVAADRLTFVRARSVEDILRLHHEADIGMDTFPYNGSTTISHALTMGVPTLTLQGSCPASRLGCSINAKVGLDEFVARDDEEFVQSALYWAEHVEELAALREALPQRFAGSVLCQHGLVYDMLVVKLRQAWVRWCSGMPPAHL
jgi:predicted O-linked N-acetylglucosamine transferase (SPINDLY family)